MDNLWIIVMFLSAVWTLILTAPIHCRGSISEEVITKKRKIVIVPLNNSIILDLANIYLLWFMLVASRIYITKKTYTSILASFPGFNPPERWTRFSSMLVKDNKQQVHRDNYIPHMKT